MQNKRSTYFLYAFGAVVLVYLIVRSLSVPPYPDEILNYHVYVDTGEFIPFLSYPDANNHLISTFFNWISYQLFGSNVIWMRFFEVASFFLFFGFLMKLRQFFKNVIVANSFVIAVSSGFFILTFFSLARGYGMSIAFFIAAIYFLLQAYKVQDLKAVLFGFVFCSFTLWSNLSMSVSILIISALFLFQLLKSWSQYKLNWKLLGLILFFGIIPIGIALAYGFYLKSHHAFWLGGNKGFIEDIVLKLSYNTLGDKGIWSFLLIAGLTGLFAVLNFKKFQLKSELLIITILCLGTLFGTVVLHFLIGVNYPHNRAALHILIVSLLFIFFVFDQADNWTKYFAIIPAIIFFVHHLLNLNLSYPSGWKDSTIDKPFYDVIKLKQAKSEKLLTINAPFYFGEVIHYYNYRQPIRMNNVQWAGYPNKIADYIIANPTDKVENNGEFDTACFNPVTQIALLERKIKTDWQLLKSENYINLKKNDTVIKLGSMELTVESDQYILATIAADFQTKSKVK